MRIHAPKQFMSGVMFYRLYQPLIHLAFKPYEHKVIMFDPGTEAEVLSDPFDIYFAASASYEMQLETIKLMNKCGRKTIIDYDDSEDCHPTNHMYALTGTEECRVELPDGRVHIWKDKESVINIFGQDHLFDIERNKKNREIQQNIKRNATALTTTTQRLRKELLKYNKNVYVMPNVVDPVLYTPNPNTNKKEVRVGWAVSSSHLDDVVSIKPELVRCLKENPTMKLVIMCFGLINEFEDLPQDRVEIIPGVNIDKGYHRVFSELKLDIGLCHLEDTAFNWLKSPLKWAEYSAMGIPTIASRVMYSDHLEDRKNVYMYKDMKEFRHAVKYLVDRPELRYNVGRQAQYDVYDMFGADVVFPLYDKLFMEVCK